MFIQYSLISYYYQDGKNKLNTNAGINAAMIKIEINYVIFEGQSYGVPPKTNESYKTNVNIHLS